MAKVNYKERMLKAAREEAAELLQSWLSFPQKGLALYRGETSKLNSGYLEMNRRAETYRRATAWSQNDNWRETEILHLINKKHIQMRKLKKDYFIVVQLQWSAFSSHPSTPPQPNPPPSTESTLPLGFVHLSFIVLPENTSPH